MNMPYLLYSSATSRARFHDIAGSPKIERGAAHGKFHADGFEVMKVVLIRGYRHSCGSLAAKSITGTVHSCPCASKRCGAPFTLYILTHTQLSHHPHSARPAPRLHPTARLREGMLQAQSLRDASISSNARCSMFRTRPSLGKVSTRDLHEEGFPQQRAWTIRCWQLLLQS